MILRSRAARVLLTSTAALAATAAVVSLFVATGRADNSLLGRARVLVPGATRTPLPGGGFTTAGSSLALNLETFGYAWRDDAMVLLWDDDPIRRARRLMEMPIATGTARPLDAFNRRLERLGDECALSADWQISPDNRWVVWPNYQDDTKGWTHRVSWTLSALDGSRAARVIRRGPPPHGAPSFVFGSWAWRPNSSGWAVLFSEPTHLLSLIHI